MRALSLNARGDGGLFAEGKTQASRMKGTGQKLRTAFKAEGTRSCQSAPFLLILPRVQTAHTGQEAFSQQLT